MSVPVVHALFRLRVAGVPRGRELSRVVEPKPKPSDEVPVLVVFQMLVAHGLLCEDRSLVVLLSDMPPE